MIPLCNVDGVASVLFTKRSGTLRAHKNEVCFPGGKVRATVTVTVMRVRESVNICGCTSVGLGFCRSCLRAKRARKAAESCLPL